LTVTEEDFNLEHDKLIVDLMWSEKESKDQIIKIMHYLSVLKKRLFINDIF